MEAVLEATPETPTPMIAITENKITRMPLMDAVRKTHAVAEAIKVKDFDKAMSMRASEFEEYYRAYMTTTSTDQPDMLLPSKKVSSFAAGGEMPALICLNRECASHLFMWERQLGA